MVSFESSAYKRSEKWHEPQRYLLAVVLFMAREAFGFLTKSKKVVLRFAHGNGLDAHVELFDVFG